MALKIASVLLDRNKVQIDFVVIKEVNGSSGLEKSESNGFNNEFVSLLKCSLNNIPPTIIFSDLPNKS